MTDKEIQRAIRSLSDVMRCAVLALPRDGGYTEHYNILRSTRVALCNRRVLYGAQPYGPHRFTDLGLAVYDDLLAAKIAIQRAHDDLLAAKIAIQRAHDERIAKAIKPLSDAQIRLLIAARPWLPPGIPDGVKNRKFSCSRDHGGLVTAKALIKKRIVSRFPVPVEVSGFNLMSLTPLGKELVTALKAMRRRGIAA